MNHVAVWAINDVGQVFQHWLFGGKTSTAGSRGTRTKNGKVPQQVRSPVVAELPRSQGGLAVGSEGPSLFFRLLPVVVKDPKQGQGRESQVDDGGVGAV
jgi:hypothetical protein